MAQKAGSLFGWRCVAGLLLAVCGTIGGQATGAASQITVNASALEVIRSARLAEPLVATGPVTAAENQSLANALGAYRQRRSPDDFSALEGFVSANPRSGWTAAVWTNLGLAYLRAGYFSRSLSAWEQAWRIGKDAQTPEAKALINRSIGERARLYASLAQFDQLGALFAEIRGRSITGAATEQVQAAHETLWLVSKDPRHLYTCGPKALKAMLLARGAKEADAVSLDWYHATARGTNLSQLATLASQKKLPTSVIFRKPGDPVPALAVFQWKVGHFAAIVGQANGRFHVKDAVLPGGDLWITPAALDSESSGYMLVPAEVVASSWRQVGANEAANVWGKGPTNGNPPGTPPWPLAGPNKHCPMCEYNIAEATVALTLSDTPVGYDPPIGPSTRTVISYNQRDDTQPANFAFYNVSQKWTLNWLSYVTDDPTNPGATVSRVMSGGGQYYYSGYNSSTGQFAAETDDGSILIMVSQSPVVYKRLLRNGASETYAQADGATGYPRNVFLTQSTDPQGNSLQFAYDAQQRLTTITDAVGRLSTLSYELASQPYKVTRITDPFGRSAKFAYDPLGRLTSITDILGITSSFTYDANSLVNSLTTPYGITTFAYTAPGTSGPPRFVDVTDPLGNHEREEWLEPAPVSASDPGATVPTGMPLAPTNDFLQYRDSFHWDKNQYVAAGCSPTGGCDYAKARATHFLHFGSDLKSNVAESIKNPLENRVWYQYPGQPDSIHTGNLNKPIAIARVLDDGTTQLSSFSYDSTANNNLIQSVDPLGRTTNYAYVNGIDLQAVSQKTAYGLLTTIAQYTYNSAHRPLSIVDSAGQLTTFTYNAGGQILSQTDALGEKTQYQYDSASNLAHVINANGATVRSLAYDAFDRISTATDSEGWVVSYAYDAADRVTTTTYPDGTAERYTYNLLDLTAFQDRLGRKWTYAHDALGNLTAVTDPIGNKTQFTYNPAGELATLTDAKGNVTTWTYDVQGRITAKQYADSTSVSFAYENTTSRLKTRTDALSQVKTFAYGLDNKISQVSYTGAVNPTATVSFTYDPYFGQRTGMTDGVGTTQYSYGAVGAPGALRLVQELGPLSGESIGYSYDALGRTQQRTIAGSGTESYQYDAIGRLTQHTNDLGAFTFSYLDQTAQITQKALTGATLKTTYSYLPNSGDRRLQSIANTGLTSADYSNFQFTSNAGGQVTGIADTSDLATVYPTSSTQSVSVNNLNQVTSLSGQAYTHDANGNLTSDGQRTYSWDAENRLVSISYPSQPGKATAFVYDGMGRRIKTVSTPAGGGSPTTTYFVWCGSGPCQARTGTGTTVREYLAEGEYAPGTTPLSLYYGVDHIGTVRRVFASDGSSPAYAYDPYGNPLQSTAPVTGFGYAQMFNDPDSGLNLTLHRAYDSGSGRWLSRDPAGETADRNRNLYTYVNGDAVNAVDPLGLKCTRGGGGGRGSPGGPPNCGFICQLLGGSGGPQGGSGGGGGGGGGPPPWLTPLLFATVVAGGGPEDPFTDALALAEEAEFGGASLEGAETATADYSTTATVDKSALNSRTGETVRPFVDSPLTAQEIQATGTGVPDPGGLAGALRYDVPGSFNGSDGTYELVVDPSTNTVYHFNFISY